MQPQQVISDDKLHTMRTYAGVWITEKEYAALYALNRQTLSMWRFDDRKAGRTCALPGYPTYRKIGNAVRYLVEPLRGQAGRSNEAA